MEVDQSIDEKKSDYRPFSLKRWNACAVWTWDVECDTCAICRLQLMEECLRCQADATKGPERDPPPPVVTKAGRVTRVANNHLIINETPSPPPPSSTPSSTSSSMAATAGSSSTSPSASGECVVVWGDCSHSFHNCCMAQWVKQNARCPLCQQDWAVARVGK
uniref:RING-type domain-containing protein n=1 Tax=Pristionchus pacificus TaxID=54126 RepID=A0A8R1U4Q7_PRIPA